MPVQPNVFKLEMKPRLSTLDPNYSYTMTLKNLATTKQRVIVAVESCFFELAEPRARRWPLDQVYHVLEPGATLSFRICATWWLHEDGPYEIMSRMTKPEGKLQIYHRTTTQETDEYKDWSHDYYEGDIQYYDPPDDMYTARMELNAEVEWGFVEMELSCEKETKLMKKQRKWFNELKNPEEKKKKSKCIIS